VASPTYLAARGVPAEPGDLAGHDCLVDTNFRDQHRWRFDTGVVAVTGPVRASSPLAIRDLAVAGLGVALSPRFVTAADLEAGRLVEVLAGRVALDWSLLAIYPRRRFLGARVRAYVDHLVEALVPCLISDNP
jgi:DNA-binding transcriptional LysR family regulator